MIKVIGRDNREIRASGGKEIQEIAKENNLSSERYIALLNGRPTTWEKRINYEDSLSFVEVFSGG